MEALPHRYRAHAVCEGEAEARPGDVIVSAGSLPPIAAAAPEEFGGPGGVWSPETLFVAAAVDCFVLTFQAIARASKYAWCRLECSGEAVLDRIDGTTRFTELALAARLTVPEGADAEKAKRLLEKAERSCLITNSLILQPALHCEVAVA